MSTATDDTNNAAVNACRTCMRPTASGIQMYSLFDAALLPAKEILVAGTALKISQDDGLPASVCIDCHDTLTMFHAFCLQSTESDRKFRRNMHNIKVEDSSDDTPSNVWTDSTSILQPTTLIKCDDEIVSDRADSYSQPCDPPPSSATSAYEQPFVEHKVERNSSSTSSTSSSSSSSSTDATTATAPANSYTCDMCAKRFTKKHLLAGHLRQHCGLRPFPCDQCAKEFDKHYKLRNHQKRHAPPAPEQPTQCPHDGCGKTYRLPRLAQNHYERIHLGLGRVQCTCDTCGKTFSTRSNLSQHLKSHLDVDQYPFQCDVCGKRFLAKYAYTMHMLRHNNIRNFPCPLCPARMVSQLELNYHVAKHDKSVPWPCPECPMVFKGKTNLRRHELKVHRGYKPYVCSYCSRAFGMKRQLLNHERLHTGERPFPCPICGRRFKQQVHMTSHVKTHKLKE